MNLYDKLKKEKLKLEKLIDKKKELNKKIENEKENIKVIQEDIEIHEMKITVKVIKSKGYTIPDVREAITSGILDDILTK
jgi:uncharacterized protein YdcH (DUF465 family)